MTLNNVIRRIQTLALGHKQVRSFRKGLVSDLFADKTALYPAVCLQDTGGSISLNSHSTTLTYRLFFLDLVHVSADSKANEQDVMSDMVSVAMDLLAQMNNGNYDDWAISTDNNISLISEGENDMPAGCAVDISIRVMYKQNTCQIPTDITDYISTDADMKYVYDKDYTATGSEGTTLQIPDLIGKKILLITRVNAVLNKVSNSPSSTEYTWNDTDIELGSATIPGERFLILYRNY